MPASDIVSMMCSAVDALAYLQKTIPFAPIRSVLQYCRSGSRDITACSHNRMYVC